MAEKKTTTKRSKAKAADKKAATTPVEKKVKKDPAGGYIYAVGRRKRAVAQTRLWQDGDGEITVNGRACDAYFPVYELHEAVRAPLNAVGLQNVKVELKVQGGGPRGQAEAARQGIARALLLVNPEYRSSLKKLGYLTRDPREKERKKPGLRKARRAPQWSKR